MFLSDLEIEEEILRGSLRIEPFDSSLLNPAGYDLRCDGDVSLAPGEQKLAATLERVELGLKVAGIMHIRSSFAREGLLASLALVDPGFRGQLTISLYNANREKTARIWRGEPFVQISFIRLGVEARRSYGGRYQNSTGVVESMREHKHQMTWAWRKDY